MPPPGDIPELRGEAKPMDQWTESTLPDRVDPPTLRAVAGHAVRVLRRPEVLPSAYDSAYDLTGYPAGQLADEALGIRVLVVGEDVLARRGVLAALDGEPGMVVVGEHRSGPGVYAAIVARQPDVLLLHGLREDESEPILTAVRRSGRKLRVLSIGVRDGEPEPALDGLMCGALPTSATPEEVVAAVRIAAAGYVLGRAGELGQLVHLPGAEEITENGRAAAERDGLSDRECEVLALVAKGMSNAEIASTLTVSEHTVKSHVQNLLSKLSLRNRIHAVIYAFETGLAG
jgi:DNA-binding NarL/FixJ family response regulator